MNMQDIHFKIRELKTDYNYNVTFTLYNHKITVVSDVFDREFENLNQFHSYLIGLGDALTVSKSEK